MCQQEVTPCGWGKAKDPKLCLTQVMGRRIDLEGLLPYLGNVKDLTEGYSVLLDWL